jgi:hypothetical protein
MKVRTVACRLYEPDGTLLADGSSRVEDMPAPGKTLWVAVADGERMVQRYLMDSVRDVQVQIGDGQTVPAAVERVSVSPRLGSICTLRIKDGASPVGAVAAAAGQSRVPSFR